MCLGTSGYFWMLGFWVVMDMAIHLDDLGCNWTLRALVLHGSVGPIGNARITAFVLKIHGYQVGIT